MTTDDDIESMWMVIRPGRLPPATTKAPKVKLGIPSFTTIPSLLRAAANHKFQCHGDVTLVENEIGFKCSCGMLFRIERSDASKTPSGPLWAYFQSFSRRRETATRLTNEPDQILLELERLGYDHRR